jgi:hypothetical protein
MENHPMTETTTTSGVTRRPRKMAREPKTEIEATNLPPGKATAPTQPAAPAGKPPTKTGLVLELLGRPEGATLDQLVAATGWLPHTTRAALTGLKKKGHRITSEKPADGPRIYRIGTASAATAEAAP